MTKNVCAIPCVQLEPVPTHWLLFSVCLGSSYMVSDNDSQQLNMHQVSVAMEWLMSFNIIKHDHVPKPQAIARFQNFLA